MKQIISIKTDKKCTMREAIALHKQQIPPQLNDNSTPFSNIIKQSATNQQQNIISNQTNFSKPNQINNNNNENPTNNSNTPTTNNKISTNSPSTIASGNNSLEINSDDNQTQQRMLIDNFLAQMISIPHEFTSSLSSLPTNSSNLSLNPDSSNFALNPDSQATTSETNTLKEN